MTLRHYENHQGESGIGNTEIFGLIIPKKWDWGTGRMGIGWYVSNGDQVIQYDRDSKELKAPLGIRIGRVLLKEKGFWNYYFEYQTSWIYEDWPIHIDST